MERWERSRGHDAVTTVNHDEAGISVQGEVYSDCACLTTTVYCDLSLSFAEDSLSFAEDLR
jgi:hypothetical protein